MKKNAFLIGISDYTDLTPLQTPLRDIEAIGHLLSTDFKYRVHSYKNASKDHLQKLFQEIIPQIVNQSSEDDQVLIYFAGHGFAENSDDGVKGFLLPADSQKGAQNTWYSMADMLDSLALLNNKHLLLVLDCCFGGAIRWASKYRYVDFFPNSPMSAQHYRYYTQNKSWQVLTSTAPNQSALDFLERGNRQHYPFAALFIKGLKGAADITPDQVITGAELYSYLQGRLPVVSGADSQKQNVGFFPLPQHDNGAYLFFMNGFDPNDLEPIAFQNPYKGLSTYEASDHLLFFGRKKAIDELYEKVKAKPLTVVVGASGTGKSSLVKAGILPKINGRSKIISPGRLPLSEMEKLVDFDYLVIDQFEQLITQTERGQIDGFWKKLSELIEAGKKLIVTVRIDFEKQLDIPASMIALWNENRYIVPPFSAEELREIIITPALRVGRFIEPQSMVDSIIDDVIHYPGSLPLLSFTMQELFEKCKSNLGSS